MYVVGRMFATEALGVEGVTVQHVMGRQVGRKCWRGRHVSPLLVSAAEEDDDSVSEDSFTDLPSGISHLSLDSQLTGAASKSINAEGSGFSLFPFCSQMFCRT